LVLAYTHGKPGRDRWSTTEKVVVPVNGLLAIGLILVFFSGKDLGATTLVVTAEDETGARIERVVPKANFRRQVALFFFANETGDPDAVWVGRWLPHGIYLDLIQDLFFDNRNPYQMSRVMIEAGAERGEAPLALMREIARKLHLRHFLEGSVHAAQPYDVETRLYLTRGGRLLASHRYEGEDLGNIIDRISIDIKGDLELSKTHIDEVEDLPVAALSSENPRALAYYVGGLDQYYFHSNHSGAARYLAAATAMDSTFVHAQYYLYQARLYLGVESEEARARGFSEAIEAAMRYIYKVPERLQGSIKEVYYLYQGEQEKALSALSLDVTLFPEDVIARRRLASFYSRAGFYANALEEYRIIRDLNPDNDLVLRDIAEVHAALGEFEQALESLHDYAKNNPRDTEVLVEMGGVYQLLGQTDRAERVYERALLLGHNPARVMVHQADLLFQRGLYREALDKAREAADAAQTAEVQLLALRPLEKTYESLGRIKEAMAVAREAMPLERKVHGPVPSVLLRLSHFDKYARTTLADSAEVLLTKADEQLPDPLGSALPVLWVGFKIEQEDRPISAEEIARVEAFYQEYKFLVDIPHDLIMARIHENNRDYRRALQGYITTLSLYPRRLMLQKYMARCYRKMGDAEAALATIEELLAVYPNDPGGTHIEPHQLYP
ncbi:MAG: tetratricopeptide repeat protein, partial [Calditrichaeota bacterium]|nr:tetratricopeptide repeat protein [Calditrichota bacterium]